jgi:NADH-dependent peroxiredoxin subunit F
MYDLVIVGAGPAGLAAAAYAIRKNLSFLLIATAIGGKSLYRVTIPDANDHRVIRADQLIAGFRREIEYLKDRYRVGTVTSIVAIEGGYRIAASVDGKATEVQARLLIIASGTQTRQLGVPGEREFAGRGLGYSTVSYSHLLQDRSIFLYGDSRRTVESALEAAAHARTVILVLEPLGKYHEIYRERLDEIKNVVLLENRTITAFRGGDTCDSVELQTQTGEIEEYRADAFFLELSPTPNSAIVSDLVETDEYGHIVVDTSNRTSAEGIFAAGDVTTVGFEQIMVSIGEGTKALLSAYRQLFYSP